MLTILLAEDQPIAREPLRRLLIMEGYDVFPAASGVEALDHLKHHPAPALIILDLMLPKLSGVRLLETIRSHKAWRTIPVIVLTGSMAQSQLARVRDLQVNAVMHKAKFGVDELLFEIREALATSQPSIATQMEITAEAQRTRRECWTADKRR